VELKPVSYLCLGMVRFGATSGYAIKKAADAGTSGFWPTSLAQIYPELGRLEEAGLLVRHDDPQGARARAAYGLTGAGEEALLNWLRSPTTEVPPRIRSEGMLRAFFSDAAPLEDQLVAMRAQRQRLRHYQDHMFDGDLRAAIPAIDAGEMQYPIALGDFFEGLLDFSQEWFDELEAKVERELAESPSQSVVGSAADEQRLGRLRHPIKLRPVSFLILGMVRFGIRSGYAIKRGADAGISFFWPVSLAQIYPELRRLDEAALLVKHDDPQGSRARAAYELTAAGEEALQNWLRSPVEALPQVRYEGMLRAFFSDALPLEEQLEAVSRQRQRLLALKAQLFDSDLTAAGEAIDAAGMRYPLALAKWGEGGLAFGIQWLGRLETRLEEEVAASASKVPKA